MLNMTKAEPELILESDFYLFYEKGMRGGVSYISKSYSKANKDYLKYYDPNEESCGYAMSKFLPTSGFKWTDPKEFDLNQYNSNSSKDCVLEVDLEYSK